MNIYIQAIIITGGFFIANIISKQKHIVWNYIGIFFFVLGILFLSSSKAEAAPFKPNASIEIETFNHAFFGKNAALTRENKQYYTDKIEFHKSNGERTFKDAKNKCWYLPGLTDRQNARYCFTSAGASLYPGTPQSKLVKVIITTLIQYGVDCISEWEYIDNKLYWAQYHFEMMEFYEEVIVKG